MGITGLLPFVKNSSRPANIKDFAGSTVAVDAYSWLHKGAFACAEKLVKGEKTDGYIFYCIKLLNMLIEAGLTPIMVFDGCNLESKAVTEKKRRENREKTRQRGKEFLCEGKLKEARECFQRCVDVTPEMAREVIEACRKKSVDCIVAPYEADAQLAYLNKIGMAQFIITEDSDLILFGCDKIFFKMDNCGGGLLYEKENLPKSFGANASKFSFEKFRYMCILSGCDYLPSLPGIGLAKACKFFSLTSITDLSVVLSKLPSYLKMPKLVVTNEYKMSFIKANNTFLHQLAFCPKKKSLVPLNPYPEGVTADDMEYAGKFLDDELACQLAMGNINVKTLKEFDSAGFQSSDFDKDKSYVWGTKSISKEQNSNTKKETAFKFNTPKRKAETSLKRKFVQSEDCSEEIADSSEDLFSMYGGMDAKKKKRNVDDDEEEPIIYESNSSDMQDSVLSDESVFKSSPVLSPPLRRIVRSRFFSSDTAELNSSQGSISTPSSGYISASEDFLSKDIMTPSPEDLTLVSEGQVKEISEQDQGSQEVSEKEPHKENVLNRFAKKKPVADSPVSESVPVTHSTPKQGSVSILDVFNSESSSTSSTFSSAPKSMNILSQSVEGATKIKPKNLFKKDSKKLITTKIEDYKCSKEPVAKVDISSNSDDGEESVEKLSNEEAPKSPLKEKIQPKNLFKKYSKKLITTKMEEHKSSKEPVSVVDISSNSDEHSSEESVQELSNNVAPKSPLKEISPYFLNQSDEPTKNNASENAEAVIIVLSDGEDTDQCKTKVLKENPKTLAKSPQNSSFSKVEKLNKCRTIGLPKKRKSNGTISKKETLLSFNFTRQAVSAKTT